MTTASIVDRAGPDPAAMIRVDASSGFLSGRSTRLVLQPDGTLVSFNATTTGEGGQVLSSLLGVATTVASFAVGVPGLATAAVPGPLSQMRRAARPQYECTAEVRDLVDRLDTVERDLALLRSRIAQGDAPPAAPAVLDALSSELSALVDRLTLSTDAHVFDPRPDDFTAGEAMVRVLAPIDYSAWFGRNDAPLHAWLRDRGVPGMSGFRASLAPNAALLAVLERGDGSATDNANPTPPGSDPTPYLFYRRPVPALVAVAPCAAPASATDCALDETPVAAAAAAQKTVRFPQLSGLFAIRIGRGGMFGTRRAVAEFDAYGAPTTLEYGSTAGGAEIAGVIDSAGSAITELRDARTAAINRRLEREKALAELNALLEAEEGGDTSP
jgi:hypothetical protein